MTEGERGVSPSGETVSGTLPPPEELMSCAIVRALREAGEAEDTFLEEGAVGSILLGTHWKVMRCDAM